MCIFTGPVQSVSQTKIFARVDGASQVLAYEMKLSTASDVAMVLPLPVAQGCAEHAVEFIDLEGYPELFEELLALFPVPPVARSLTLSAGAPRPASLVVHDVGAFVASFVPTIGDFSRLDERFRLSPAVWEQLPGQADYGFAVFQLKAGAREVHPMAFRFPTRDPGRVFFPTVHVHDGAVHEEAVFEHVLYGQAADGAALVGFDESERPPPRAAVDKSAGLLVGRPVYRLRAHGLRANDDIWADLL